MSEIMKRGTFVRAELDLPSRKVFVRRLMAEGMTKKQAQFQYRKLKQDEIWVSKALDVQVNLDKNPPHGFPGECWHLSIKHLDKRPLHDWRILQEVKNQLVGRECEAIELYPAEARVVDTSNQYHLFAFPDPEIRIPCGWQTGGKIENPGGGAVQRPFAAA